MYSLQGLSKKTLDDDIKWILYNCQKFFRTPYWLYCTTCSLFKLQITIYFRLCKDILHVLPYANCALNPFLYIWNSNILKKSFLYIYLRRFSTKRIHKHRQEQKLYEKSLTKVESNKTNKMDRLWLQWVPNPFGSIRFQSVLRPFGYGSIRFSNLSTPIGS